MRAPEAKRRRRAAPQIISARLSARITLEVQAGGTILALFDGDSIELGTFGPEVADHTQALRAGLPLASFASGVRSIDKEIEELVRRLARHRLVEYGLRPARSDKDDVIIEPQVADYWPATTRLGNTDILVLSRFTYMRRRGNEMVLESLRAGALFRICNPAIAAALAMLAAPQPVNRLRRQHDSLGLDLLALLVDCQILLKIESAGDAGPRGAEGDLVLWDFHDLLFHTRSTEGRHANPLGGVYPHAGVLPPLPALRPRWPGKPIDLRAIAAAHAPPSPFVKLLRERHSIRSFDDQRPITLGEVSRLLDGAARILPQSTSRPGEQDPTIESAARPYPSAGACYELELYLAVDNCEGLARGFYHYDADRHALVPISTRAQDFEALLQAAQSAMDAPTAPQILITIAARFGRVAWKYSSLAYALILKDVGILTQSLYLMTTDMELGGCAIGITNIELFAKMTGIEFHVEGPVGQFALGRGARPGVSDLGNP
ncbi:MAG: SagB family peptide dehydrogenase [Xanthobacteraceae bacterium]